MLAALSVLTGVALMLRRSRPVTVLAVSGAAAAAGALVSGAFDGGAVPLALYALAVYGSARHAWIGFGGVAVLIAVVAPSTAGEGPWPCRSPPCCSST